MFHSVGFYSSKWAKAIQLAISIRRAIATFLGKKSFQRIYDLGVSCKADCREILVDYSPLFLVSVSFNAFLFVFLTFVTFKYTAHAYKKTSPLQYSLGVYNRCETSPLSALHFFGH